MILNEKLNSSMFNFHLKGEYMKYTTTQLAQKYNEFLSDLNLEINLPVAPPFDTKTYNEYNYQQLSYQLNSLYDYVDSFELSERFLKGD